MSADITAGFYLCGYLGVFYDECKSRPVNSQYAVFPNLNPSVFLELAVIVLGSWLCNKAECFELWILH